MKTFITQHMGSSKEFHTKLERVESDLIDT